MAVNNAINIPFPLAVQHGGTGQITLTNHSVLVGNSTSGVTQLAVGSNGQPLIGATSADPKFASLTSSGSTITFTPGPGTLDLVAVGGSFGKVIKQVNTTNNNVQTVNAPAIPYDDTIPQNNEGTQVITCTITPQSVASTLWIYASIQLTGDSGTGTGTQGTIALFQDSNPNALNAHQVSLNNGNTPGIFEMIHIMTAGTTSATTFKIRTGLSDTSSTWTLNGRNGMRLYGGTQYTVMYIWELE